MAETKPKRTTTKKTASTAKKNSSTTPKKAASASKSRTSSKGTATAKKVNQPNESFQSDIILLLVAGAAVLMMVSEFGNGGVVGNAISGTLFGIFGAMAYIFPICLILTAFFIVANKGNKLLPKKVLAILVLCFVLCGFLQHITEGYYSSMTLMDYYHRSADYHSGGGIIGGAVCISTVSAFGLYGSFVILGIVLLICLILITQKSLVVFLDRQYMKIVRLVSGNNSRRKPASGARPQRERKIREKDFDEEDFDGDEYDEEAEIRRRQERIDELNRALADLDELEELPEEKKEKEPFHVPELFPKKKSAKKKKEKETDEVAMDLESDDEISEETKSKSRKKSSLGADPGSGLKRKKRAKSQEDEDISAEIAEIRKARQQLSEAKNKENPSKKSRVPQSVDWEAEENELPFKIQRIEHEDEDFSDSELDAFEEEAGEIPARRSPQKNPKSSKEEIESGIQNIENEIQKKEEAPVRKYNYPPLKLLKRGDGKNHGDSDESLRKTAQKLEETLHNFGVNVTVTNVSCGPTVTQYELQPEMGVKVSRIVSLADDIKLNLATPDIRIEAPIPGKAAIGIEVPNKENSPVMLRDLLQSQEFQDASSKLSFAVGKNIAGKPIVTDIAKMPHLLIAGSTGSGKSVCINTLITSILYKASPDEVKMIMIDPKVVELSVYNGIPHLLIPVVTDPKKAAGALNWAVQEMTRRYNTFAEFNVRKLEEYNHKVENMRIPEGEVRPDKMPQIVVIVDELADLMMVAPGEVEDAIVRLTQLARAAGIHLIIATQRPSVNVITGLIKANMPSRIAFAVSSGVDSRTILDSNGAEKLLGKGDMLFYPQGYPKPARLQGAFVSDDEVSSIVEFLSSKNPAVEYNSNIEAQVNTSMAMGGGAGGERDVYFEEAGRFIIEKDKASIGMLQRMFKIGFNRAARIMDQLSDAGVVGPEEGTKPRKILMSESEFETYLEEH